MRKSWCLILMFYLLAACDSPMNNRIEGTQTNKGPSDKTLKFQHTELQVKFHWLKGPFGQIKTENQLLVLIYKDGNLFSLSPDQRLQFYAWMPSMGHPMEDAGDFIEIETGIYLNKTIRFNMGGEWLNKLWILDAEDNPLDEVEWPESL